MTLDDVPFSVVLSDLADAYETVAAMPPVVERVDARGRTRPGSRVPPGVSDVLDEDEYTTAVQSLDEWAEYVAHVVLDEVPGVGSVPDSTPARLRLASRWTDALWADRFLGYALEYDAREHLVTMRRLSKRGIRTVRTGSHCLIVTCSGEYVATIDGPDVDGDLVCSACGDRVGRETWERWGSRAEWVTVEHAASMAGCSVNAVRIRAHRQGWRRQGSGRDVRYHAGDVLGSTGSGVALRLERVGEVE